MDQVKPGLYAHFKGNHYRVLGTAQHTETHEKLVFYYPLSEPHRLFARPLTMFVEQVQREDYQGPRFHWLED
ncbi:MAG: DUF1653 domain-containing protein [Halomonadaceae bacterium]|nr:MAG: DUF1653 domain-containing protein [Halomonadaceae bacterium]